VLQALILLTPRVHQMYSKPLLAAVDEQYQLYVDSTAYGLDLSRATPQCAQCGDRCATASNTRFGLPGRSTTKKLLLDAGQSLVQLHVGFLHSGNVERQSNDNHAGEVGHTGYMFIKSMAGEVAGV